MPRSLVLLLFRAEPLRDLIRERRLDARQRRDAHEDDRDEDEERDEEDDNEARGQELVALQDAAAGRRRDLGLERHRARGLAGVEHAARRAGVDDEVVRERSLDLGKLRGQPRLCRDE